MAINNFILFGITLFCWSPTWYIIKFQLGYVDPLVSVFYRFLTASIIIFIYLIIKKKKLKIFFKSPFMVFIFWYLSLFSKLCFLLRVKYLFN